MPFGSLAKPYVFMKDDNFIKKVRFGMYDYA